MSVKIARRKIYKYKQNMLEALSYGDTQNYQYWKLEMIYILKQFLVKRNIHLKNRLTFDVIYNYLLNQA